MIDEIGEFTYLHSFPADLKVRCSTGHVLQSLTPIKGFLHEKGPQRSSFDGECRVSHLSIPILKV